MTLSPMMQQYTEIKEKNKECILFFRLGDFYEMFFEDAKLAAKELELVLTGKNCGLDERAPMCGVPYHAADSYIAKLIEKGYRVAICEQTEDPASVKGLVKREVVKIVTPGTVTTDTMLDESENNYLASIYCVGKKGIGFSYCDVSTGELCVTEFTGSGMFTSLMNELVRIDAKEIIINDDAEDYIDVKTLRDFSGAFITYLGRKEYNKGSVRRGIFRQFEVSSYTAIGMDETSLGTMALGAQISYLLATQKQNMKHINSINLYNIENRMALDKSTIKNLELTETIFDNNTSGSLLGVLDKTNTAMGSRKMKKWIREPLKITDEIQERLDAVEALIDDNLTRNNIRESLKAVYDFERLSARISCGNANGKDLIALKGSLFVLPELKLDLEDSRSSFLRELGERIHPLKEIRERIDEAIVEDPPFLIKEGKLIKEGFSEKLDELKNSISGAKEWIAGLEEKERERTGIKNLKIGYNKVFGYYIEITKSNYDMAPNNYIRKQTLANAERFVTPELKEMESKVLNAETLINKMEYELFTELREFIKEYIKEIQKTSSAVSDLDVLASFAEVSDKMGYVKPEVNESDEIIINNGRHPVIEQTIEDGIFVANDTYMNREDSSLLLITGPNMSGKSTYMRQTALIVLMAQIGCFVPCEAAKIGIVDRIFTRIGASDNLSQGQSTFFVEMSELAYILNYATTRSLVILDEIGRGTSTYDGLSIAWAVAEYLTEENRRVRTLFASHYHELTELDEKIRGFKNLNVDVAEENGEVVFLHKIIEGSASKSYGVQVAKLAGVPKELLDRANDKLCELEEKQRVDNEEGAQISLFTK